VMGGEVRERKRKKVVGKVKVKVRGRRKWG
jgi:hypothetical protein